MPVRSTPPDEPVRAPRWSRTVALGSVAVILGLSVVATIGGRAFFRSIVDVIPGEDWTAHAVLYAIAALLCGWAFGAGAPRRTWRVAAGLAAFSFVEECTQLLLPDRTFAATDLLANAVGIALGTMLARTLHSRTRKTGEPVKLG